MAACSCSGRSGHKPLRPAALLYALLGGLALAISAVPASAASNNVRITGLTDLSFGSISSFVSDSVRSEDLCVFSSSALSNYRITASGSGTGGAFAIQSGTANLPYEVQWSPTPGQTSGASLTAGVALTGQHSNASHQNCNSGPVSSASLIVIIRRTAAASAMAGSYTGTLSLLVAPE